MTTLRWLADRPTWLLTRANARAHALLTEAFATRGLRGYHARLLAALDELGPASQAELGRHAEIDRSDVVACLNDLIARGFATRQPDPADRRRNIVTITARGRRELARLSELLDGVQRALLAPLSAAERRTFVRLLAKLVADDPVSATR
jgi:DNA-binding MarR family transcriptional regulator